MTLIQLSKFYISTILSYLEESISLFQMRTLIWIIVSIMVKVFTNLNRLVMKMGSRILILKI
jgi:hypothetical protein